MADQICPDCGYLIFPHELCCPCCHDGDPCRTLGIDAGAGSEDGADMLAEHPERLAQV